MTTILVVERRICLEPEKFDKNLKEHILNKVKENSTNECSKEYGYILSVNRLINIKDNNISSNCEHVFTIEIEIENLKPEIGKNFMGTVCMIFAGGIFINIKNKLKVLIPVSNISKYKHDQEKNCFVNINNAKKNIKQGDELEVIISGIRYSKQNFSCFGNMYNE